MNTEKTRDTPRYIPVTSTRCGKCKHLKRNLPFYRTYRRTDEPYICEVHGETLPELVAEFWAEKCEEFEQ